MTATEVSELHSWDRYFAPTITMLSRGQAKTKCPVTDARPIGSYNWADSRLVVPGAPAEVQLNLKAGLHLKRDIQATTSADEDYVEHSLFPLEPLFLSVLKHNPKFRFQDMGLATDCANLTALYGFMRGTADTDFSVDVTRVGELILFQQVLPTENSEVPNFSHAHLPGYQQDFVLRYALKERRHSKGQHHRVIQCRIGGLNVLVRSLNTAVLHKPVHERTLPDTLTRDMYKPEFTDAHTGVKPLRPRLLDTTEGLDTSFSDLRLGSLLDTADRKHTQSVATRLVLNDSKESDADPQYDIEGTSGGEADEKVRHGDSTKKTNPASSRLRDWCPSTRTHQCSGRNKTRAKDTCGNKRDARAHPRTGDRGSHARSTRDDMATRAQHVHSQHSGVYGSRGVSTATTHQYTSGLDLDLGSTDPTAQVKRACSKDTTRGTTSRDTACSTVEISTRGSTDTHTQAHYSQTQPTQLGAPSPIPQKLPTPIAKVCGESNALRVLVTPLNHTTMEQPCDSPAIAPTSSTGMATELTKRDRRPEDICSTTSHVTHTRAPESRLDVLVGGELRTDDLCVQLRAVSTAMAHEFDYEKEYIRMLLTGTHSLLCGVHTRGFMESPPDLLSLRDCEALCTSSTTLCLNRFALLLDEIRQVALQQNEGAMWTLMYTHARGRLVAVKHTLAPDTDRPMLPRELHDRINPAA